MDDSVFTQEGLKSLDECILSGARSLSIGEKSITFHSLDELLKLRNQVHRFITGATPMRTTIPIVTKGLYDGGSTFKLGQAQRFDTDIGQQQPAA